VKRLAVTGAAFDVANICVGTGRFGTAIGEAEAFGILDRYAELGGNFVDTAHVYAAWLPGGAGASERTVGRWLRARGARDRIVVGTKGGHPDLAAMEVSRLSPTEIRRDLAESLERLAVDRVDFYWLHRDDPAVPVSEILGCLNELIAQGLVRAIGASNWTPARLEEARAHAARTGVAGFCASQVAFSLAVPNPGFDRAGTLSLDREARRYHESTRLLLAAYSSQAKGFFSGKYARNMSAAGGAGPNVGGGYFSSANFDRLERATRLGQRLGRTANEIALAYLFSQPFPVVAIVGPRSAGQLAASCAAADLALDEAQVRYLEGATEGDT
jgi:aryl-alcohol dehydrogenase-like predicted oxidoreductase